MATDAEAAAAGFALPQGADFISEGDNAITQNAKIALDLINDAKWYLGATPLPMPADRVDGAPWWDALDLLTSKSWVSWAGIVSERYALPTDVQAVLNVKRWGAAGGTVVVETRELVPRMFLTARLSGGWTDWVDFTPAENTSGGGSTVANRTSGFKTLPLSLTAGNGGSTTLAASAEVTYPMSWNAKITRFRVCIADKNPRFGINRANSVTFTNVRHGGGTIASSGVITEPGEVWKSPYTNGQPTGDLAFGYSAASPVIGLVGGGTINGVAETTMPFHVWIEAETAVGTPSLAVVGDSNSVGVGTARPLYDSWLSQYCRRIGALPVHYGASGDSLAGWTDPAAYKWNLWNHLDRADAVLLALGSNSMANPEMTQDRLREESAAVAEIAAAKISAVMYMITIKPRNGGDATYNTLRRDYNTWVKTKPIGVRDWLDMVSPVSADDTVMLPGMFASDGTHMNTTGHKALADSITKTLTVFGGVRIDETAGRTVKVWDYLNNREQVIYGETGLRNIIATFDPGNGGGSVYLSRSGDRIEIIFSALVYTGNALVYTLPSGFKPSVGHAHSQPFYGSDSPSERVTLSTTGTLQIFSVTAGATIYGSVGWTTSDPWPTALPGVSA